MRGPWASLPLCRSDRTDGGGSRIHERKRKSELIWASPRELLNIFQADGIGCHFITITNDTLKK